MDYDIYLQFDIYLHRSVYNTEKLLIIIILFCTCYYILVQNVTKLKKLAGEDKLKELKEKLRLKKAGKAKKKQKQRLLRLLQKRLYQTN